MLVSKHLLGAAAAVAVLFAAPIAMAKGPQGVGHGASPTFTPGVPQNQGAGNSDWSGAAPGWSNAEQSKGWDSSTPPGWDNNSVGQEHGWDSSTPPGWDNNSVGQEHGWDNATAPPGIQKR